jgi:hypothetical protein
MPFPEMQHVQAGFMIMRTLFWAALLQAPLATCFTLVSCLAYTSNLKMKAECSS